MKYMNTTTQCHICQQKTNHYLTTHQKNICHQCIKTLHNTLQHTQTLHTKLQIKNLQQQTNKLKKQIDQLLK